MYGARTGASGSTAGGRLTAYDFLKADAVFTAPIVDVYKSVKLTTDADGTGSITPGDTLTYTVTAVNTGNAAVTNFQLTDTLPDNVTITSTGAQTVKVGGTAGATNTSYTGLATANTLLAASQTMAANSTISVDIPVKVGTVSTATSLSNQATASGAGMSPTSSDNVDTTTSFAPSATAATGWAAVPAGSVAQTQAGTVDATLATITPAADLAITKTDGVGSVNAGSGTTYTVRVSNTGPSSVTGAILTDAAVPGLTVTGVACSATPGQCTAGTTPTRTQLQAGYALPTLASGQTYELTVTGTVTATSGSVANTATIAPPSGTTDPTPGNNSATDTDTVTPVADLSITKTDGVTNVNAGGTTTYTVTLTNNGPSSANGTVLTDPVASGLSKTSVSCSAAGGAACPAITTSTLESGVTIATLPAGGSITLTIATNVTATSGSVTNSVTAALPGGTTDVTPTGTVSDTDTVTPVADLSITKTDGVSSVNAGSNTTYTIRVTRAGPSTVTGATLTDAAVAGLNVTGASCSATPGQCTAGTTPTIAQLQAGYALPALTSGQFYEIRVTATVTATSGTVVNTATIAAPSGTIDPTSGNNSAADTDTVNPVADLSLTKTDNVGSVTAGGTTSYTITLTNAGPSSANGTVLTDPAAPGLSKTGVSCAATGGAVCPSVSVSGLESGVTVATLPAGGRITLTVGASVTATSGSVTNSVTASLPGGTTDPTPVGTVSDTDTVTPAADLAITKTDGVGSVNAGSGTTYTVRVSNTGPSSVTGAILTDAAVPGLTVTGVACSATPGQCTAGTTPTRTQLQAGYALPTLASGQTYELTVTGTVTATSGSVANTATIAPPSGTTDPTPGNNSATDTDTVTPVADLSITKTDGVGSFHVGSVLTYTVVVGNAGPSTAVGATVSDPLPSGIPAANMSYTAAVSGGATSGVTGTQSGALTDSVTLPAGGSVTYTVTITVPATYPSGTLVNTAAVTAPGGTTDPAPGNNSATDTDTREAPVANDDSDSTNPLVDVTFNITGNDLGPVDPATVDLDPGTPGQQTTMTDTGKGSYSVDSSGNVTFSPAAGFVLGTSTITYTVKDALGVSSGAATIRVSVPAAADLAATKTGPAYARPGEAITYTITVSNKTSVPAGAYTVTDTLDPGLTFVSASAGGTYDSATRTVTWSLLSLTGSGQQLLTVTATAPSAAQIAGGIKSVQNTATVSLTGDPASANNTSGTVTTGLILSEITKRVRNVTTNSVFGTSGGGMPKQVLEYCLDARNLGGVDLGAPTGYRVRDLLPVNVSALLTAYDSAPTATGTGNGVQVTRGAAAPTYLKSSVATLTDTSLNVNLGVVTAGETVTVCFQATIR